MRLRIFLQMIALHIHMLVVCCHLYAPFFGLSHSFMLSGKHTPLRALQIILFPLFLQDAFLVVCQLS